MPLTLDQVIVPAFQQMLDSASAFLAKAQTYAADNDLTESDMLGSCLSEDMWPLPNQIQGMWAHSAYAIDQVKIGAYRPNAKNVPTSWAGMDAMIQKALADLDALQPGELDEIADTSVHFVLGDKPLFKFIAQNFLLSFSMPNVHFHATTAYNLMRHRGVPLGKFDFLGGMRNDPLEVAAAE